MNRATHGDAVQALRDAGMQARMVCVYATCCNFYLRLFFFSLCHSMFWGICYAYGVILCGSQNGRQARTCGIFSFRNFFKMSDECDDLSTCVCACLCVACACVCICVCVCVCARFHK